jgi:hypothetical protein
MFLLACITYVFQVHGEHMMESTLFHATARLIFLGADRIARKQPSEFNSGPLERTPMHDTYAFGVKRHRKEKSRTSPAHIDPSQCLHDSHAMMEQRIAELQYNVRNNTGELAWACAHAQRRTAESPAARSDAESHFSFSFFHCDVDDLLMQFAVDRVLLSGLDLVMGTFVFATIFATACPQSQKLP